MKFTTPARLILLAAASGFSFPASSYASEGDQISATYDVYWTGLKVFTAESNLSLEQDRYHHQIEMQTKGVLEVFVDATMSVSAQGRRTGDSLFPDEYASITRWNDRVYDRFVTFDETGRGTLVRNIEPEDDDDDDRRFYREAVPEELAIGPDPLTLFTGITLDRHQAFEADGPTLVKLDSFDGLRSITYEANCALSDEPLSPSSNGIYAGEAISCDLTGRQTGGFWKRDESASAERERRRGGRRGNSTRARSHNRDNDDDDDNDRERIESIKVWFAQTLDLNYFLPVRMEIRGSRDLDIYLAATNVSLQAPKTNNSTTTD